MKITLYSSDIKKANVDTIVVPVFEQELKNSHLSSLGSEYHAEFTRALKSKEFTGKFGSLLKISTLGKLPCSNILLIGLGKKKEFDSEQLRRATAKAHKTLKAMKSKTYLSLLTTACDHPLDQRVFIIAESALLSDYAFTQYQTQNKEDHFQVSEMQLHVSQKSPALATALNKAQVYAKATNYTRDLVNLPPNVVYPSYLAREALKLKSADCKVTVFDKKALMKGKFGGILAVGQGSVREPRLVVIEYNPKAKKTIALVGKGITFDSGGLNIKPGGYMETMKCDMSGAGAVLGIINAAKELKFSQRIIGVLCCAENMPGGLSYRPDDILTMYNGKTVEVGNTDAEGRLVLADGLAYVEKKYSPDQIIDYATLTGACVVALGFHTAGLLTKNDDMASGLSAAGMNCGDRVWRLPLWDEYKDLMKSSVADVRNISSGRDSGTITAAIFLNHFVKKTPWAHIDIAGTAFRKEAHYYHPKDGTGAGVRLTLNYLESL